MGDDEEDHDDSQKRGSTRPWEKKKKKVGREWDGDHGEYFCLFGGLGITHTPRIHLAYSHEHVPHHTHTDTHTHEKISRT